MLPALFCEKMKSLLGAEYEDFLSSLDRPRAVALRLNPLKCADPREKRGGALPCLQPKLSEALRLTPVPWARSGYYYDPATRPGLHPDHAAGVYYLQEASAMAPAALLDAQPGERVLDLCAAPGGKTTQIAADMNGRGLLVCNEIHPKRAAVLASNVERMGIANALVLNEHPNRIAERFPAFFDRVLVDAPCSGEGMFRKHDAASNDWSFETVSMCAARQAEILDCAAKTLRPGGRLVYSTCTFAPEENEQTVEAFLGRNPSFEIETVQTPWFAPGRPEWANGDAALAATFRLWPHRLHGEGHFAAVLRKQQDGVGQTLPCEQPVPMPTPVLHLLQELGQTLPEGVPVVFGNRVFLAPPGLPALRGLRILRPGLELAELRRELAVPAHALALWAKDAASCHEMTAEDAACLSYLNGQVLPSQAKGWTLVRVDGFSLGWGKGSGGILKNHYPKGLRISSLQGMEFMIH